ncbi:MAG: hypothetical protein J6W87_02625 [Clostridia bacterium]|nr:hypothetical protein [Clostridia bacterium]
MRKTFIRFLIVLLSLTLGLSCFFALGCDNSESGNNTFSYKEETLTLALKDYDGNFSLKLEEVSDILTQLKTSSSNIKELTTKEEITGFLESLFNNEEKTLNFEIKELSGEITPLGQQITEVKSGYDILSYGSDICIRKGGKRVCLFYLIKDLNEIYIISSKSESEHVIYGAKTPDLTEIFTTYINSH